MSDNDRKLARDVKVAVQLLNDALYAVAKAGLHVEIDYLSMRELRSGVYCDYRVYSARVERRTTIEPARGE